MLPRVHVLLGVETDWGQKGLQRGKREKMPQDDPGGPPRPRELSWSSGVSERVRREASLGQPAPAAEARPGRATAGLTVKPVNLHGRACPEGP